MDDIKEITDRIRVLRQDIDALIRQYQLHLEVQRRLVQEIKDLKEENGKLKIAAKLNSQCYFAGQLPFRWG